MRTLIVIIASGLIVLAAVIMGGCAPTQFRLGAEVPPPWGCIEARNRGHEC